MLTLKMAVQFKERTKIETEDNEVHLTTILWKYIIWHFTQNKEGQSVQVELWSEYLWSTKSEQYCSLSGPKDFGSWHITMFQLTTLQTTFKLMRKTYLLS